MAITFDEVALAAEAIKQTGDKPTIEKVRLQLGSRGSNSTIAKHLYTWKQSTTMLHAIDKVETPNVVQAAVDSVWQQIREQTDTEIEKIKEVSREQIELAQKQAIEALELRQKLNEQYIEMQASYHAVSAEKEILILDLRKLREEHQLLQERYNGLDGRYTDMQSMAAQQLKIATDAHQTEISRLEQTIDLLKIAHQALVDEIKEQSETERHRQIMVIENLKADRQKQDKHITQLQETINASNAKLAELATQLQSVTKERDEHKKRLFDQEMKWQQFNDKILISDDMYRKLNNMPKLEKTINRLNDHLASQLDSGFSDLKNEMKRLANKMELQDE